MERNRALSNAFAFACNRLTIDDLFDRLRWRCLCAEPLRTTSRSVTKRSTWSSRAGWICQTILPEQRLRSISQLFRIMAAGTLSSEWTTRLGNLSAPAPIPSIRSRKMRSPALCIAISILQCRSPWIRPSTKGSTIRLWGSRRTGAGPSLPRRTDPYHLKIPRRDRRGS